MLCFCAVLLQRQIPRAGNAKGIIRPPGEIGKEQEKIFSFYINCGMIKTAVDIILFQKEVPK